MSVTVPGRNVKSTEDVAGEEAGGAATAAADEEEEAFAAASSAASVGASISPAAAGTSSAAYLNTALRSATSDASSFKNPAYPRYKSPLLESRRP